MASVYDNFSLFYIYVLLLFFNCRDAKKKKKEKAKGKTILFIIFDKLSEFILK